MCKQFLFLFLFHLIYFDCDNRMKWNKFDFNELLIIYLKIVYTFWCFRCIAVSCVGVCASICLYLCLFDMPVDLKRKSKRRGENLEQSPTARHGKAFQLYVIHTIKSNFSISIHYAYRPIFALI